MTPNFNAIAPFYRWLEYLTFGPALSRCRNYFLPALTGSRRALVLGDGDGRFLARLLASNPHLHADAVDLSPAMLARLMRRANAAHPSAEQRLRTIRADARKFQPSGAYDLIVTHFFLDCLTESELDALTLRLRPHLAPEALWLISDFRIPGGPLRLPAQALVRMLYLGFRVLTHLRTTHLPDHAAALSSIGLNRTHRQLILGGLLTTELWQLKSPASSGV